MRIDPESCRDPDLLAAEVRRLQGVIAAGEAAITDEEREVLARVADDAAYRDMQSTENVVRGLLERAPRTYRKTDGKRPIANMSGDWISVLERLPDVERSPHGSVECIVACSTGLVTAMRYTENRGAKTEKGRRPRWEWNWRVATWEVTHWMPLPAPPTDGK
jgi:hypothetical protein